MAQPAKKHIPGLGKAIKIQSDEIELVNLLGNGTTASIPASGSLDVVISHQKLFLNTVPEVTTSTGAVTSIVPVNVTSTGFTIRITNGAGAQVVAYSWTRNGI